MKVADIMTTDIGAVPLSAPVIEVAHQMKVSGRWVVPVCDHDEFRGLITERDIVVGIVANAVDPVVQPASCAINERRQVVSPGDDIIYAAKVMANSGMRALAVVQDGKLAGLLTLEELAWANPTLASMVFFTTLKPQVKRGKDHKEAMVSRAPGD